ncbi:MAG TPA: methyltransferase domain-containing protein [Anaerolineae bacterium]
MLTETEFYDRLAESFDVMTDWKSRLAVELPFLQATLAQYNARSVLDCACGTGWHAIALAQRDYKVAGSDISPAMIARARENAAREQVEIPFTEAGFQALRAQYPERFNAVLCLGNSLPHVLSDEAALDSLTNMHDCLNEGGVLILHNLNYDKRWREKPRWFAVNSGTLGGHATIIWRFADYVESGIVFNIALFTKGNADDWSVDVQSTPQHPYQKTEIENMLLRAGFHDLAFYGSLRGDAFDAARSGDLVVVGRA